MTLSTANGRTEAVLEHATFCGIGLTGTLKTDRDGVEVRIEPKARGGVLNESIRCIMPEGRLAQQLYRVARVWMPVTILP